jgi:hypothetical protein
MNEGYEKKEEKGLLNFGAKSEEFLETFFRKGAEFTEQLLLEVQKSRTKINELKEENINLRSQLASDDAVKDLLAKIKLLEEEKKSIRQNADHAVREYKDYEDKFIEMEKELDQMANLYVASAQLHAAMDTNTIMGILEQLLMQLVGASSLGIYLKEDTEKGPVLRPVHAFHCDEIKGTQVEWNSVPIGETAATQVSHIAEPLTAQKENMPIACIPLVLVDTTIGVIVIYELLEQKKEFVPVDFEIFRLLSEHGAAAITGSSLFSRTEGISDILNSFETL